MQMKPYVAAENRYDHMKYRKCGRSGLYLPLISLGLWQNFGANRPYENSKAMLCRAFDLGITHFDLANNYGPPAGSAEETFGQVMKECFRPYRDELIISSKAGWGMWPGPYGDGSSRKYLMASLDQSLKRMGLDYVDIFYSHRFNETTPLEETMGALADMVKQGKALYVGISSYDDEQTRKACKIMEKLGVPLLIHQPSYSILNRWVEPKLLGVLGHEGMGSIAFCPLAQGLLTSKYLSGIPEGSRATFENSSLGKGELTEEKIEKLRALNQIAKNRGQSLAQMALAWILKDERLTSALIGASRVEQIEENVKAIDNLEFSQGELDAIDAAIGE